MFKNSKPKLSSRILGFFNNYKIQFLFTLIADEMGHHRQKMKPPIFRFPLSLQSPDQQPKCNTYYAKLMFPLDSSSTVTTLIFQSRVIIITGHHFFSLFLSLQMMMCFEQGAMNVWTNNLSRWSIFQLENPSPGENHCFFQESASTASKERVEGVPPKNWVMALHFHVFMTISKFYDNL